VYVMCVCVCVEMCVCVCVHNTDECVCCIITDVCVVCCCSVLQCVASSQMCVYRVAKTHSMP